MLEYSHLNDLKVPAARGVVGPQEGEVLELRHAPALQEHRLEASVRGPLWVQLAPHAPQEEEPQERDALVHDDQERIRGLEGLVARRVAVDGAVGLQEASLVVAEGNAVCGRRRMRG